MAGSLVELGIVAMQQGSYDQAHLHYQQSMNIRKELEDRDGEVDILEQLGLLYTLRGDAVQAQTYYRQAKEMSSP
jgi:tetratricopeptide (TPR) repeat protein